MKGHFQKRINYPKIRGDVCLTGVNTVSLFLYEYGWLQNKSRMSKSANKGLSLNKYNTHTCLNYGLQYHDTRSKLF